MTDKSRAAFEATIKRTHPCFSVKRMPEGEYQSGTTENLWLMLQESRRQAMEDASKQKASKPKRLAKCGTGALHDEQQYCFEIGYKAGAKAVRTVIRGLI